MGLGKTIQSLGLLWYLYKRYHIRGPFLIVTPTSTLHNWASEIKKWTEFELFLFHGEERNNRSFISSSKKRKKMKFNIVLTNYETLKMEKRVFRDVKWKVFIVDEAQTIKNPETKVYKAVASLKYDHLIILTGTPIQNQMIDFW